MADTGTHFWLTEWNWEPSILIGTALIVGMVISMLSGPAAQEIRAGTGHRQEALMEEVDNEIGVM
jgi:hypothetical protein